MNLLSNLKYVVITSVARDDLHDHGASYHEYVLSCGVDYHANTILTWLGY